MVAILANSNILKCSAWRGIGSASRIQFRCFAFSLDPSQSADPLRMPVTSTNINFPKLAGGIVHRCRQGLPTQLEAMGAGAVSNAVKSLVLANSMAQSPLDPEKRPAHYPQDADDMKRVCFIPSFESEKDGKTELKWIRFTVVPQKGGGTSMPNSMQSQNPMKASGKTDFLKLTRAIYAQWNEASKKNTEYPVVSCMGKEAVSTTIKAMAMALSDLRKSPSFKGPFFLCHPTVEALPRDDGSGELITTFITMEPWPEEE
eukprot:gnl/MRDRNA2_/MRDRNA2_171913_c0_seq1.p1 gnl/MRDRNA2_/MRDRNA2_171913_c0~~gnl/MRDRNA2_/MRDRNA2_171913_c0_seq1.p1  ORF type:complete len:268 (-),score=37.86 gnl/MRDRNA2_/MRDRNA2_171913_c0_seq1:18-794(-)